MMSVYHLTVSFDGKNSKDVQLRPLPASLLARKLLPIIEKDMPEQYEQFNVYFTVMDMLSIDYFPQKHYAQLYSAIINACDEIPELKSFKPELQKALKADERFKESDLA